MSQPIYTGTEAFQEDPGTIWTRSPKQVSCPILLSNPRSSRKLIRTVADRKPVIWFVDDERANREWFVNQHGRYFCILTFSSRKHFDNALDIKLPIHAAVTDIFFPANELRTDSDANNLLSIYEKLKQSAVKDLPTLWQSEKDKWILDGFSIARRLVGLKRPIPVFLFSRKAVLLLSLAEFLGEPPAVRNTYWLIEKVDPTEDVNISRKAADMQRDRIASVLDSRTPIWIKFLSTFKIQIGWPPGATLDLKELLNVT